MADAAKYSEFRHSDDEGADESLISSTVAPCACRQRQGLQGKLLLVSGICNTLLLLALLFLQMHKSPAVIDKPPHDNILPAELHDQIEIPIHWAFEYSAGTAADMEMVDRNWDAIEATHGLVALDQKVAAENGLPPSIELPSDPSKAVYSLEGYHSLHCLVILRKTMFQLARGQELDVPFGHSTHCLGSLLQATLCNADSTLLHQIPGKGPGDGQSRKCRNWPAMRDWASENSACFFTNATGEANEDRENCNQVRRGDGILLSDWPGWHVSGKAA